MGTGYVRNDTAGNIVDGGVIEASDLDGEFDAIVGAFASGTGHTHDGTLSEGGAITLVGPAQDFLGSSSAFYPKVTATYTLGEASKTFLNIFVDSLTLGGVAITSSPEELNTLDGVTSTAAEFNILDGATLTTAELNVLAGLTSTTSELNVLDGLTSTTSELNLLDGVTATTTEINLLDGITTSTTEFNILTGATLSTTELNYLTGVTSSVQTQMAAKQPLDSVLTGTTASFTTTQEAKLSAIDTDDLIEQSIALTIAMQG